ncbi:MAG: dihydropteroate synthase [bacterium]|nr:dihydropteroate synthase [bacterium]
MSINTHRYSARVLQLTEREEIAGAMASIGVDPRGIGRMLPKAGHYLLHLSQVPVRAAMLIKQGMLSRDGDAALSWEASNMSAENTDIIMMGTDGQLRSALDVLCRQPFGLPLLAQEAGAALDAYSGRKPCWRIGERLYDPARRTLVMGILNVTPDSFSDGGRYLDPDRALEHALQMIAEGADIIDIGAESTRPGAGEVAEDEEIARLLPVIERLVDKTDLPISVDTRKAGTAAAVLQAGASIINDISGLTHDPDMAAMVADVKASLVVMHIKGTPETMHLAPTYEDLMGEITSFLYNSVDRAAAAGVAAERIAVDPGIGFGKTWDHNLEILRRLMELRSLGRPILVGASRKAFIGAVLDLPPQERQEGTLAVNALAVANGASIIRVHDVGSAVRTCRMVEAVLYGRNEAENE